MCTDILKCKCGTFYIPQRYILTLMTFFAIVLSYCNRTCLHVAITRIVVPLNEAERHKNTTGNLVLCKDPNPPRKPIEGGEYNWSEFQQASVLIAFYWGYLISQLLPGGIVADFYGAKHVLGTGVIFTACGGLVSPLSITQSNGNPWPICLLRFLMGVGQGVLIPASMSLVGKWAPKDERARLGGFVATGSQMGNLLGNLITSTLIKSLNSWPYPFYFWSILTICWYVLYLFTCYSKPSLCPHITEDEAVLLEREIGVSVVRPKIPWKKLLTSVPVWTIIFANIGHSTVFHFLSTQFPKYLDNVLHFNLQEIGLYTSMPFLLMWIAANISGIASDCFIKHNILSVLTVRKMFCTFGDVVPGICLLVAINFGCNRTPAIVFFTLSMLTMGPFYPSLKVNPNDISKNFAGIITALSNGISTLMYLPMPHITGMVTKGHSPDQWITIGYVMGIVPVITNIPLLIWGSAERQKWDQIE